MANEKLIYANALKAQILWQAEKHNTDYLSVDMVVDAIDNATAVDAVEVVHGRWILGNVEPGYFTPGGNRPWVCSECGQVMSYRLDKPNENYCPNCGEKMDGDGNG